MLREDWLPVVTPIGFLGYHTYSDPDVQLGTEPIPATEAFGQGESWNEPCLNVETDDLFFADDTIFGFFAQE